MPVEIPGSGNITAEIIPFEPDTGNADTGRTVHLSVSQELTCLAILSLSVREIKAIQIPVEWIHPRLENTARYLP